MTRAWLAIAVFVLSPFALLAFGGLPPDLDWRLVIWLVLFVAALIAVVRAPDRLWLVIALVCALPVWAGANAVAMGLYYPCWRYSNASWCGHFCDDDACACPDRGGYGAGDGCRG